MTEDTSGLSRRKLLGSVATIGGAAALGGAGSVAFFSDREEFANNRLVAGSLDLKVDWAEYYSDWSEDEADAAGEMVMAPQDTTLQEDEYDSSLTGLPTPNNALVAVENPGAFLEAAAVEAYPDANDDGMVDSIEDLEELGYDVCIHGADTPEDLDPTADPESLDPTVDDSFKTEGTGLRTNNDDTVTDGEPEPLIALDDVKPGDFGEVTISLHLCDNDGYIALTGEERYDNDNTLTEPERKDPDETDGLASGELGDTVRAAIWMDGVDENDRGIDQDRDDANGNNLVDEGEEFIVEEATLSAVVDALEGPGISLTPPGAMTGDEMDGGTQTGTLQCATTAETVEGGTGDPLTISDPEAGDSFEVVGNSGNSTVTIDSTDTNDDGDVVGFSFELDGPEELADGDYPGVCTVSITGTEGSATQDYGAGGCVRDSVLLPAPDQPEVGEITEVDFDLCTIEVAEPQDEDPCFNGSDTYYLGFAWWVPVDHGNEIQTDSYGFDLGFYAEQCRHNPDGIGNVPEPEGE